MHSYSCLYPPSRWPVVWPDWLWCVKGLPSQSEIGLRLALLLCCKFNFVFRWAETSCWLSLRTMIHRAESAYAAKRFLWWGLWVQSSIRLSSARVFCLIVQPWQINAELVVYSRIIWIAVFFRNHWHHQISVSFSLWSLCIFKWKNYASVN